jgi:cbb3-type cytochrome oxidase subunit 3
MLAWHLWAMATAVVVSTPLILQNITGSLPPGAVTSFAILLGICLIGLAWSLYDNSKSRRDKGRPDLPDEDQENLRRDRLE